MHKNEKTTNNRQTSIIYDKMATICAKAEYCTHDIIHKLSAKDLTESQQKQILKKLTDNGFIDDRRYAEAYATTKATLCTWGPQKIDYMLKAKKIDAHIREEALSQVSQQVYLQALQKAILSKKRTIKGKNEYDFNRKLMAYAYGRGYTTSQIRDCISSDCDEDDF